MSILIRSGRGKAKPSEAVKTDADAMKVVLAVTRGSKMVSLSTGDYTIKTREDKTNE